jgi:sugar fermentation stimulation protein A
MNKCPGASPFVEGPLFTARFVDRPNRFLVRCDAEGLGRIRAFMPNPGRMWELLLPDVPLYVTETPRQPGAPPRKTQYTVVAVERDGAPVFLHTHVNNHVARHLIEQKQVPTLKRATLVRAEAAVGRSRFDFLLRERGRDVYVEVKSCTLFGNGVAMFPDAVTERGRRHLLELAELGKAGARAVVLFIIHTPRVHWFMPDFHTDLAFSQTFLDVRRHVKILPLAVEWTSGLELAGTPRLVEIPWKHIEQEAQDRGSYIVILHLKRKRRIVVGGLGDILFEPGFYLYAGSAMRALAARITRHRHIRKRMHWHIDYLRQHADSCTVLPIRSSRREEIPLVEALASEFEAGPDGFGASDSPCATHLFRSCEDPLALARFHAILERFRMRPPV